MICFSETLQDFVSKLETKPYVKHASLALYVQDEEGKVLLEYQGEKSLIPNSILKLFTTAAALKVLGEDFRFHTRLLTMGRVKEGKLEGDVVIQGDGDPTLGRGSYKELLGVWTEAIKAKNIRQIEGAVHGDASCFEKALSPASWLWEDLGNYYGAGACGLNFHENSYSLFFRLGNNVGEATQITQIEPSLAHITVVNEVVSGPKGSGDRAVIFGGEFSNTHYVRGSVPLDGATFTIRGSIPDPAQCCAEHLQDALQKHGITSQKMPCSVFEQQEYVDPLVFWDTYSPSLADMVFAANQYSINLYCECFLKKMGQHVLHQGTHAAGLQVVNDYLKYLKVSLEGCHVVDGSGLSSQNLVTARSMVHFLSQVSKEPYFSTLYRSLPSNTENRRLNTIFSSESLKGRIRAKTGYSSEGESVAGFFTTAGGKQLTFCLISNHCLDSLPLWREDMRALFELLLLH